MRLLAYLLISAVLAGALPAQTKPLPEKVQVGDAETRYPAECARRIDVGKALLDAGDLAGAKLEFDQAVDLDAFNPMAYFYQAVVAYRQGDYAVALRRAELGLNEAIEAAQLAEKPDDELTGNVKRLKELYDTIKAKHDSVPAGAGNAVELLRAADEAYANGLLAKAATGYAQAYRADPSKGETGLKAATLYADRLKNPLEAARLWQQVLAGGEPHASTARLELQSHRDALDAVLQAGLAKRDQWRSSQDPAEPLKLAEAFPESTELQLELAYIHARKGRADDMIKRLQAASRLGLNADDFRARTEFVDVLERVGVDSEIGQRLASFLRDAYADETIIAGFRAEIKRRYDERMRLANEKAAKERQAKLAAELKELNAWRNTERGQAVNEISRLVGAHNNIEIEVIYLPVPVVKKAKPRNFGTNNTHFSWDGRAYMVYTELNTRTVRGNGAVNGTNRSERYTFASTASLATVDVKPSTWLQHYFDQDFQIVEPYRALCRLVEVKFRSQVVRQQSDWRNIDGEPLSPASTTTGWSAAFNVMLTDQEAARLQWLFTRLSHLDAAGDNVEKLRQLRR